MSAVSATNAYSPYTNYTYSNRTSTGNGSGTSNNANSTTESSSATNVTLSPSAKAALAAKSFDEVIAETRATLLEMLDAADTDSPYNKDGELVIDLSGFDRRELYAIASNTDGTFTDDEITAAAEELTARFDKAMAGPVAVYNVTGNITRLYNEALEYLEAASPEEQKSPKWIEKHNAVTQALSELKASPTVWPEVENDPVVDYLARVTEGTAGTERDFPTVADDARAALDQQIADAEAQGETLLFSKYRKNGIRVDFSDFSSRALSAIALNEGEQFSTEEIHAAKDELSNRSRMVLLSCISDANSSSDPTALAQNIISAYGTLSSEERQAVGWGEEFYEAALANYKSVSYITSMLGGSGSGGGSSGSWWM